MKRMLAMITILTILLSLCACGSSHFIGTYERELSYLSGPLGVGVMAKEIMELTASGEGTFRVVSTKDDELFPAGTALVEGTVSWEETDGTITIAKSEINFVREDERFQYDMIFYSDKSKETFPTESYILEDSKLINRDNNKIFWNKSK